MDIQRLSRLEEAFAVLAGEHIHLSEQASDGVIGRLRLLTVDGLLAQLQAEIEDVSQTGAH